MLLKMSRQITDMLRLLLVLAVMMVGKNILADAFVAVKPSMAPRQQQSSLHMTVLSYNGKKKDFKPGSPLSKAVAQLGVKPNYSCKK